MSERFWVGRCVWASAEELALVMDRHISTVNRGILNLYGEGLVGYVDVGRVSVAGAGGVSAEMASRLSTPRPDGGIVIRATAAMSITR